MRRSRFVVTMVLALAGTACASGGSSSGTARSDPSRLSLEELDAVATYTALEAINRLRPQWLRSRTGEEPIVFLNGSRMGGIEVLRNFQVSTLSEIRFRNGRDATTRYGTGFGGGTIEMRSRGQEDARP